MHGERVFIIQGPWIFLYVSWLCCPRTPGNMSLLLSCAAETIAPQLLYPYPSPPYSLQDPPQSVSLQNLIRCGDLGRDTAALVTHVQDALRSPDERDRMELGMPHDGYKGEGPQLNLHLVEHTLNSLDNCQLLGSEERDRAGY